MFAQLVSKQAEYAISYGTSLGNTISPRCIAISPIFFGFIYVKPGSRCIAALYYHVITLLVQNSNRITV